MSDHYDVIIVGTGAGGGTLAYKLAPSGKRILLLERGDYVPREKDNWNPRVVNAEGKYQTPEVWRDRDGNIVLAYTPNNVEAHKRLIVTLENLMQQQTKCAIHGHACHQGLFARNLFVGQRIPLAGVAHQNGTIRFGRDPKTSALDPHCKTHELDNLYVVDASFFPSLVPRLPAWS